MANENEQDKKSWWAEYRPLRYLIYSIIIIVTLITFIIWLSISRYAQWTQMV